MFPIKGSLCMLKFMRRTIMTHLHAVSCQIFFFNSRLHSEIGSPVRVFFILCLFKSDTVRRHRVILWPPWFDQCAYQFSARLVWIWPIMLYSLFTGAQAWWKLVSNPGCSSTSGHPGKNWFEHRFCPHLLNHRAMRKNWIYYFVPTIVSGVCS